MSIVTRVLHDDFVRADRPHLVVETIARAPGFAINAVQRMRMHYRARRPRTSVHRWRGCDHLQRQSRLWAKRAERSARRRRLRFIAADNPRSCDGIFAQFHHLYSTLPTLLLERGKSLRADEWRMKIPIQTSLPNQRPRNCKLRFGFSLQDWHGVASRVGFVSRVRRRFDMHSAKRRPRSWQGLPDLAPD